MEQLRTCQDLDDATENLEIATRQFLMDHGWDYTSRYFSIWFFVKEIDGKTLIVPQNTAILIEDFLEEL